VIRASPHAAGARGDFPDSGAHRPGDRRTAWQVLAGVGALGSAHGRDTGLGFGKGMTAREIRTLYAERGDAVFPLLTVGQRMASVFLARPDPAAARMWEQHRVTRELGLSLR
jgi:hypothetical protein